MIKVVSHPSSLKEWEPKNNPFYLELFGETSPLMDMKGAKAPSSPDNSGPLHYPTTVPIYEYYWTIGLPGNPKYQHPSPSIKAVPLKGLTAQIGAHFYEAAKSRDVVIPKDAKEPGKDTNPEDAKDQSLNSFWEKLEDIAAEVYLLFPINGNWRIQELVATVKYLIPAPPQHAWLTEVDHVWQAVQPIVGDVGVLAQTAGTLTGQPEFDAAGSMLSAIAKTQINSVPPTAGYTWSVNKETYLFAHTDDKKKGVWEGLRWTLPKQMFTELGGRLTGSVAVSFIQVGTQQKGSSSTNLSPEKHELESAPVCAYAAVYLDKYDEKSPVATPLIELWVEPILPDPIPISSDK